MVTIGTKFVWQGETIRESTKHCNDRVARQIEAAHRTSLAKGEVGIRDKKQSLTLAKFCDERFEPWAKSTFERSSPKTWLDFYRVGIPYTTGGAEPKAMRIRLADHKVETIASLKDLRRALGPDGNTQISVAPDGSPVFTRDIGTREIYALTVKWP